MLQNILKYSKKYSKILKNILEYSRIFWNNWKVVPERYCMSAVDFDKHPMKLYKKEETERVGNGGWGMRRTENRMQDERGKCAYILKPLERKCTDWLKRALWMWHTCIAKPCLQFFEIYRYNWFHFSAISSTHHRQQSQTNGKIFSPLIFQPSQYQPLETLNQLQHIF